MITLYLFIIAVCGYFLGGLNGAIIASRFIFRKDIRKYGSGNAGLTNFYRTFGAAGVAAVLAIDILKTVLACLIGGLLLGLADAAVIGKLFAGFCVVLGHSYPAFYQLRGGKGVLCGVTAAFMVNGWIGFLCLLTFFVVVVFTRLVSLGSLAGTAIFPLLILLFQYGGLAAFLALLYVLAIFWGHRGNIARLRSGTERKLQFGPHVEKKLEDDF